MNKVLRKCAWLFIPMCWLVTEASGQTSYDLRSPDKRIEVRIRTEQGVRYDVVLSGRAILQDSSLALNVDHKTLGREVKVVVAKESQHDQVLEPVVRQKFAKIRDHYNELRLELQGNFAVVFRAYNEGVAYRFETSFPESQVKIYGEDANFRFPANDIVFYPQEDSFFSHNERKYLPQHLLAINPAFLASLPAVVDVGEGAKVAIGESDVEEYPGLWLRGTNGMGLDGTFPPYPLKEKLVRDRDFQVVETADYIALTTGTRTYPWRVMGIVERDADLLTNPLVYLLEKPSQVQDTSWIHRAKSPGIGGTITIFTARM